jgi:hypothetical protein
VWQLMNLTPFAAERAWIRDRDGAEVWQVAIRASFTIRTDGRCEVAEEQSPVRLAPQYADAPYEALLLCDTDLPLLRHATDVLVSAHAHAPSGRRTPSVDVSLRTGPIDKTLRVWGDRIGRRDGSPGTAEPFLTMPVTYLRALGGPDARAPERGVHADTAANPCGVGVAWQPASLAGCALPNCEFVTAAGRSAAGGAPAGFGPIAPAWASRARFAGTYDAPWESERAPLVPDDLDDRFFQSAPSDQQVPQFLRGGEAVELLNLSPEGLLQFALPRVELRAQTRFVGDSVPMAFALLQVAIDVPSRRVELSFLGSLRCHARVHELEKTIVKWKPLVRLHAIGGVVPRRAPVNV